MKLKVVKIGFLILAVTCVAQANANMKPRDPRLIKRFDYKGVTLEESRWKDQFELVKSEYMSIPVDDLLIGFRKRAGFNAPGKELGGWYSNDVFNIFGQVLSGLSRIYAATGDTACKTKVDELIEGWATCVRSDGYFFYSNKPNAMHYTYEKMVGGLLDAYVYCGNQTAREMLTKITDWAIRNLEREKQYGRKTGEWYTLSENLYKSYIVYDDIKYYDFAEVWEYTEFWNHYAFNKDIFSRKHDLYEPDDVYHAYSHVNSLSSAAAAYLIKGDRWYLDSLINAHDSLVQTQIFATGGYGPHERFLRPEALTASLGRADYHFETTCGSWAVFKMCKYLLEFTGDARFGDWIELMMYNGVGASLPLGENGSVQYTSNYSVLGAKKTLKHPWSCCAGTRPMAVADYHDLIWFHDSADDIYLNLYTPSTLKTQIKDTELKLTCKKGSTEFENFLTFATEKPVFLTLNLRVPNWSKSNVKVTINDQQVQVKANEKHWIEVKRDWSGGDKLYVQFPASINISRIDHDKPMPAALVYGPVVLACEEKGIEPVRKLGIDKVYSGIVLQNEKDMFFGCRNENTIRFRPYFSFGHLEPYLMYIDDKNL